MQISRERQEIEKEKSQLLSLKQEIIEEGTRTQFDRKKLRITKASLARLQCHIMEEEQKNCIKKKELTDYEVLIMKRRENLVLKEKMLKDLIKIPFGIEFPQKMAKVTCEEDKGEPDISHTYSSKNKRSDNEEINASGITAKFPNNTSNSKDEPRTINSRKELELEDKLKAIEEEKARLEEDKRNTENQMTEIQRTKAHLARELEMNRPQFSFVKKGESDTDVHDIEIDIHESKQETPLVEETQEQNDSMEFKPDPDFLRKINERIEENNKMNLDGNGEDGIQNVNISQIDNKDSFGSDDAEDSSDESSVYRNSQLYDEPKKAKYGIKPVKLQT